MRPRFAAAVLAVLAALTTTACVNAPSPSASSSATPSPTAKPATVVLEEAAAKSQADSYEYALTYGDLVEADGYQAANGTDVSRNVTITQSGLTVSASGLIYPDALYIKIDPGALAAIPGLSDLSGTWLQADMSRISQAGLVGFLTQPDANSPETFLSGVVSAEQVSPTEITGVLDLAQSGTGLATEPDLTALGDQAHNIPFTATLDNEGRIATIVLNLPALGNYPAADLSVTYSNFGAPVEVPRPTAAESKPLPDPIYSFLSLL